MAYVEVVIGAKQFTTDKRAIVRVNETYTFIETYKEAAFEIACYKLGLDVSDCCVLDWRFLGEDVIFIN